MNNTDKNNIKTEKDLKNQLIDNIIKFLNELGISKYKLIEELPIYLKKLKTNR